MPFSEFVRSQRIKNGTTLREFCRRVDQDPSNWSKIERGILAPPKTPDQLSKIAEVLGFQAGSNEYDSLFELAAIDYIPKEIVDKEVLEKLPIFFRTIRGDTPTNEELNNLIAVLKSK